MKKARLDLSGEGKGEDTNGGEDLDMGSSIPVVSADPGELSSKDGEPLLFNSRVESRLVSISPLYPGDDIFQEFMPAGFGGSHFFPFGDESSLCRIVRSL